MPRLGELQARLASIGELDDIVGAMRALAAVRMRQALDSLRAARAHADTIRTALDAARMLLPARDDAPPPSPERLVVVFCTEHGFAGAINEHLLDRALAGEASSPPSASVTRGAGERRPLVVVGSRGVSLAKERGLDVVASLAAPSHPSGVLEVARRTAIVIAAQLERLHLSRAEVVYGRGAAAAMGTPPIASAPLLPVPATRSHAASFPPLHHLEPRVLVEQLVAEYVVAELAQFAIESLAAESSARMQAMSAARDNIERKLAELRRAEHRARQDQVTTELLDLITGAEATK